MKIFFKKEMTISMEKKKVKFLIATLSCFLLISILITPSAGQPPENFNFGDNFYTTFGLPEISGNLIGSNEFERGDKATLEINLVNKGVIEGFRSEIDAIDDEEIKLQELEKQYESDRTTAIGIVSTLHSQDPEIKVKSGSQEAGTLRSGEQTATPVPFDIEISKNAKAGIYKLEMEVKYAYQENVQVGGRLSNETLINREIGLWYEVNTQKITIPIKVKDEADFSIVDVKSDLRPNDEGILQVTYKNQGEMTAKDTTVRITVADPFSTTDDQAYLGLVEPGESKVAIFRVDVSEYAIPKTYPIISQIRYEDTDGHDRLTSTMRVETEVLPAEPINTTFIFLGVLTILIIAAATVAYRKIQGKQK